MPSSPAARRVKDAYLELLSERPGRRITVTAVAHKAHINRITFYRLYETLDDVLVDMLDDFDQTINDIMGRMDFEGSDNMDSLRLLLENHRRNMPMLRAVLLSDKAALLERRIEDGVRRPVLEQLYAGKGELTTQERMHLSFYSAGIARVVGDWIRGGCQEDVDEVVAFLAGASVTSLS